MESKQKKHKKGKGKGNHGNVKDPSPNSLSYNGPIISRAMKEETDTVTTTLNFTGILPSSAGGVIDTSYSNDPASFSLADWTAMASVWHEYRALGLRVEFFPYNRYSKASTVCTPMIVVIDRQSSGTIGSYQAAMNHSSAKKVSLEDPWIEELRMQNAEEAQFISTGSTQAKAWIKMYSDGLSVSTTYGRCFVYLLLQFRGRK